MERRDGGEVDKQRDELRSIAREVDAVQREVARLTELRTALLSTLRGAGMSLADLAADSGLTRGRVHQVLAEDKRSAKKFLEGLEPAGVSVARAENEGLRREIELLLAIADRPDSKDGGDTDLVVAVPPISDQDLDVSNGSGPFRVVQLGGLWAVESHRTGLLYRTSPPDPADGKSTDYALVGRGLPDSSLPEQHGILFVHGLSSLAAEAGLRYFRKNADRLYEAFGRGLFAQIIRFKVALGSNLATGPILVESDPIGEASAKQPKARS